MFNNLIELFSHLLFFPINYFSIINRYYKHYDAGQYACLVCGEALFSSETKYESGSGWPAFYDVLDDAKIMTRDDASGGELYKI